MEGGRANTFLPFGFEEEVELRAGPAERKGRVLNLVGVELRMTNRLAANIGRCQTTDSLALAGVTVRP